MPSASSTSPSPKWRVYYGDKSTYSDEDGSPFDAPARNVQGIVHFDVEVGRKIVWKKDVYWWMPEEEAWYGASDKNLIGFWDYCGRRGFEKYILQGRSLSDKLWAEISAMMLSDPDFPVKSAWREDEERV